jgi:hypothetical protein
VPAAAVPKAPAGEAKLQAAAAPQAAPPKAVPAPAAAIPAAAIPAAATKQKVDAAAKVGPVAAPPPIAKAAPKSTAALVAHAAPGRSSVVAVGSLDKPSSLPAKRDAAVLLSAKPAVPASLSMKQPPSVGDKRPRQEAAAVDEVDTKRVAVRMFELLCFKALLTPVSYSRRRCRRRLSSSKNRFAFPKQNRLPATRDTPLVLAPRLWRAPLEACCPPHSWAMDRR